MPYSKEYLQNLIFTHLHVHSEYSNLRILDSINKIKNMIEYVISLGQNALALTDHESLSGHVEFLKTVKKLKKAEKIPQDFKPILGNEIYLVDEDEMNNEVSNGISNFYHFLLLAKDAKGHQQLRELSSRAWSRMFSYKNIDRVPTFYSDIEEVVGEDKGHLIASTACLGGYIPKNVFKILSNECEDQQEYKRKIHNFINWNIDIFGKDDFYIELQPSNMQEQIEYNKYALKIANAYNLKHIITTDAHYLKKEERNIHKAYLTSDDDEGGNREVDDFYSSTYFFSVNELLENMIYLDTNIIVEGINNTIEITNKIEIYDLANKQVIPKVKLPNKKEWFYDDNINKIMQKYEWINKMILSDEIYDNYLISLIQKGIKERIKADDYNETFERIDIECKEILKTSEAKEEPISSYFVTMVKNIDIIWDEANAIVAPGRGSAGGFIIDYLIGITQINPLKQGILMPHWRFICAERPDYPDIDIDIPSHKRDIVFKCLSNYYQSIGGLIVRVCTFGTETAKSTILTACRGLKINNDIALYLSSLIPVERGKVWSIEDCYYGNPEKNRNVITEFKNLIDEYEELLNVAIRIQGLINKRSSHACGILIVNDEFTKYNALMRTPSGELVSQFSLEDSEYVGNIKYDLLNTKTCAMIQVTLEMLVEHNIIKWQGNLRKTYDKYLHPDIIDKESIEMWDLLNRGELISAFQFDSPVGEQALKAIKPISLLEATNANNLMRLMVEDGAEQPLEMYVRYKEDINRWFEDMKQFGLKPNEIEIMKKHLLQDYGVCSTQEGMMLISMDENIAGFDVVESNILRKGVAKKIGDKYEEAHKLFYKKGEVKNTSNRLLDYVWDIQIAMQKGYGFSLIHGIEYTYILIQQLNLVYYYPSIFWNTGVLLVESGALEQESLDIEEDEENSEEEVIQKKEKTTNYGTIAKVIGNMQQHNISIELPHINKANLRFIPDIENDKIIFGLKGIMKINNETSKLIMEHRPFKNLDDFYQKMVLVKREVVTKTGKIQNKSLVSTTQTTMLIKAGAFDEIEKRPREEILEDFLHKIYPDKKNISSKTIEKVIQYGIVPSEFKDEMRIYRFRNYIMSNKKIQDLNTKTIKWHSLNNGDNKTTDYAINFFNEHFACDMEEGKDYKIDENGDILIAMGTTRKGSFAEVYNNKISKFDNWLNSEDCLNNYNELVFSEIKNSNMNGTISTWEMESMNFYYHEHELININKEKYCIEDFDQLPEEPVVVGTSKYKGRTYPKFQLSRIIGTVLDRDKTKHSVTLLTPTSVVQIKFYSGQFSFYDKQISVIDKVDGKDKKVVLEEGWFKRGNKLLVTGFRRGDQFKPKRYKNSIFPHSVQLITGIENDSLILQSERIGVDAE